MKTAFTVSSRSFSYTLGGFGVISQSDEIVMSCGEWNSSGDLKSQATRWLMQRGLENTGKCGTSCWSNLLSTVGNKRNNAEGIWKGAFCLLSLSD